MAYSTTLSTFAISKLSNFPQVESGSNKKVGDSTYGPLCLAQQDGAVEPQLVIVHKREAMGNSYQLSLELDEQ